jgi:hypothetical protein
MGNSEDVFLESVNVFTALPLATPKRPPSLYFFPNQAALKLFESCSYTECPFGEGWLGAWTAFL